MIVSGGRGKLFNHERYWNDCAFLYRTLHHDYAVPPGHIVLLMADGDDPATDMLLADASALASQPTDLDGDGCADLSLAATRSNLYGALSQLSARLTPDDRLFIFITDHGERTADGGVALWLWGDDRLGPDELATWVSLCRPASMCILLGQCYAGAFATSLQAEGRVVVAACSATQLSWACSDRPYDEFVYHWTCAVARHDEQGRPVDSDADGDGRVTLDEAFAYASSHDRRPETPAFWAQPLTLAKATLD